MKKLLLIYLFTSCTLLSTTSLLGQTWKNIGPDNTFFILNEITEIGGNLYAVGSSRGSQYSGIVSKYENSSWTDVGSGFDDFSRVHAIAEYNGDIYIGGNFTMDNGTDASFNYLAKWDDSNSRWIPVSNGSVSGGGVFDLFVYDGLLYAGGNFDDLGQSDNDNLAAYNGTSWSFIGNSSGISSAILANTATHQVTSMVEYDGDLIVGGKFNMVDGTLVQNIASWDGTNWTYLKGSPTSGGGGVGGDEANNHTPYVKNMVVFNSTLFIAGKISKLYNTNYLEANSTAVSRNLVAWDGTDFTNPSKLPSANTLLQGVAVFDGKIYFGAGNQGNLHSWNGNNNFNWVVEPNAGLIWSLFSNGSNIYRGTNHVDKLTDPTSSFYYSNATPCRGENISYTDTSTGSTDITAWAWTFEGGTPSSSRGQNPSVVYSSPGQFDVTLEVTSSSGTDITKKVDYVNVDETITIDSHPGDVTECPGVVNFEVAATTVSGTKNYQWQVDDGTGYVDLLDIRFRVFGATTRSLGIYANTDKSGYKYKCKIASCNNESISNEATLTVNDGPVIVTRPTTAELCISGDASYTVEISGGTGITYQWQSYLGSSNYSDLSDDDTYSGTNTATLSLTGIDENLLELIDTNDPVLNRGDYRCIVSSSNGCTINTSVALKVYKALPAETVDITAQPVDVTGVCANAGRGRSGRFRVRYTTLASIIRYSVDTQWQVDDGTGFVDIENTEGSYSGATSRELTLSGVTHSSFDFKYRCKITVACGNPIFTNEVVFEVDEKPVITLQPVSSQIQVCEGSIVEYTVTATGTNLTYQWQRSSSNIADNNIYTGTTSQTLTIDTEDLVPVSGQYGCVISSNGSCSTTSGRGNLRVYQAPSFSGAPADRVACEGGNLVSFAKRARNFTTAVNTYKWQEAFAGSDIFVDIADGEKFSGTNGVALSILTPAYIMHGNRYRNSVLGCDAPVYSEPATLTVNQLPLITTSPESQSVCAGESITFTAKSAIGTGVTYQWMVDRGSGTYSSASGQAVAGSDGFSTYTISRVAASLNGYKYKCVAIGATPCNPSDPSIRSESIEATLTVNEVTILSHPEQATICRDENASFTITAQGEGLTYQWQQGGSDLVEGGVYAGATTATLTITGATAGLDGSTYGCVVGGNCEAVRSKPNVLRVSGVDKPEIFANFNNAESPTLSVTNVSGDSYEWFLDGTPLGVGIGNRTLTISQDGSYTVIVSSNGCPSELSDAQVVGVTITGFEKEEFGAESLFPNPIKDQLTITLDESYENAKIRVLSLDGKMRISQSIVSRVNTIDMTNLSSGIYMVEIVKNNQKTLYKVIKE